MNVSVSLRLDHEAIRKKIDKALADSPSIKRLAYKKAYGVFYSAKRAMLKEFDRHNITQELLAGPNAVNISGTLDGYGNLFSFIGFERGDAPTERLRTLLDLSTSFEQTIFRNRAWYFRVSLPNRTTIEGVTQMPWERGNSWAYGVENYISGLSNYLYTQWDKGRSGMGLQLRDYDYTEGATFSGQPYITEILDNFRKRINKDK